jgi:hypothetical protein
VLHVDELDAFEQLAEADLRETLVGAIAALPAQITTYLNTTPHCQGPASNILC